MLHYRRLDHVGFTVSSLERSIPFYTFLLGNEPVFRASWDREAFVARIVGYPEIQMAAAFWQLPGGAVLELIEYQQPACVYVDMETSNVGNAHLGLVTDDIHAEFERLRDHVDFRNQAPVLIPSGPFKGGYAVYFRDPDGITIEIIQEPRAGADAS